VPWKPPQHHGMACVRGISGAENVPCTVVE
jgi:hypothetical protein